MFGKGKKQGKFLSQKVAICKLLAMTENKLSHSATYQEEETFEELLLFFFSQKNCLEWFQNRECG